MAEHAGVEPHVVACDDRTVDAARDLLGYVCERRRITDHACIDAVNPGRPDIAKRIDQRLELVLDRAVAVDGGHGDFDHAVNIVEACRGDGRDMRRNPRLS